MINTRRKAATRRPVPGAVRATSDSHPGALSPTATSPATDRQAEYRALMRKWWFGAAIGAPTMILSYPSLIPGLRDFFPRGSEQLWWLWVAMGVASLAVIVYSGNQFFTGAWEALKHRSANMHTLIAIGTGTAWLVPGLLRALPGRPGTVRLRSAGVVLQRRPRPLPRKRVALRLTNVLERANSSSGVGFRGRAPAAGRTRAAAPSVRA